jgi:hypothetical protein
MMQSRLGTKITGPDGVIYGFFNDQHVEEDVDGGVRVDHVRALEVPTDDLGTIAMGTVLTIDQVQWKVWNWPPRRRDDGLVSVVILTEAKT